MKRTNKLAAMAMALAATPFASAFAETGTCSVSLTQDPLVMRVGKDEFRIAFGLDGASCKDSGCSGVIKYNTTWETEDGTRNTEQKSVSFNIPNGAERSISVDRHYFDTAEAQHTTQVVSVNVDQISCGDSRERGFASR
jgi:hypothetical protein